MNASAEFTNGGAAVAIKHDASTAISAETAKAVQEVQAALVIAKKFPRDQNEAYSRIMTACGRKALAENALYAYPKGGQVVTGPSIRLAEMLVQNWGNIDFGIRELSQADGVSEVEAYCWDMQTNSRSRKTFHVKHIRYSKAKGNVDLTDPRDIYEMTANQGARRLRACILAVIPGDVVEAAVEQCEATLNGVSDEPIEDRIKKLVHAFKSLGVSKGMLEARLGHKIEATINAELTTLRTIFKSLKDGMASRDDFFDVEGPNTTAQTEDLQEKLKKRDTKKKKKPVEPAAEEEPEGPQEPPQGEAAAATDEQMKIINDAYVKLRRLPDKASETKANDLERYLNSPDVDFDSAAAWVKKLEKK